MDKIEAAKQLRKRKEVRGSYASWCRWNGFEPARHHTLIVETVEKLRSGVEKKVILLMPPGAAKTTYTSKAAIPWLMQDDGKCVLACSYSKDLVQSFGRWGRNCLEINDNILGLKLKHDTKAADEWECENNSRYFCAGVGSGIAGHRADYAIIDDYLGNQEDADSQTVRDKQWAWYFNDFWPRLKPNAAVLIIANRRHEDDLVGRLLKQEGDKQDGGEWLVIKLPYFARDNDPLGRQVGERLWPEWFTEKHSESVRKLPARTRACLYDQDPSPEEGDYFKAAWFDGGTVGEENFVDATYTRAEYEALKDGWRYYGAGDFAVSTRRGSNCTCLGGVGVDHRGHLYVLPRLFLQIAGPKLIISNWLQLHAEYKFLKFIAEKGHISKCLGPFMQDAMREEDLWMCIEEVTPSRDKGVRARVFQGLAEQQRIHFPSWVDWYPRVRSQLLHFTGSGDDAEDDFVDKMAHLCNHIDQLGKGARPPQTEVNQFEVVNRLQQPITFKMLKDRAAVKARHDKFALQDN